MNRKYLVFGIIAVMLVSLFVVLSRESFAPQENNIPQNNTVIDNTATPKATASPSPTTQTTIKPNPTTSGEGEHASFAGIDLNPATQINPLGVVGQAQKVTKDVWKTVAFNAWQYYTPGIGVSRTTGIPRAVSVFPLITDWDVGVYIQAIIDAKTIGVLIPDGEWGANDRIEKVLKFLETRPLKNGLPYQWYSSNGKPAMDWMANKTGGGAFDITDAGRLLVALNNLKAYNPALTQRIDNVTKVKPDYSVMLPTIEGMRTDNGIYGYIVASGFAAFFPSVADVPSKILDNILNGPKVDASGVQLPKAPVSCDPLFVALFDMSNATTDYSRVKNLTDKVYLAHEAHYDSTKADNPNSYIAFGEGNSGYGDGFIYEWVVDLYGNTWVVQDVNGTTYPNQISNVYTKVAFCFLSVYKTEYARNTVVFVENNIPQPTNGYCDGVNNADMATYGLVSEVGTNTNGLIIGAAKYAIQNGI